VSIDPGGSGSTPRSLSARESGAAPDATPYEGVPDHLVGPLRTWVNQFLAAGNLRDRVAARLQIGPAAPDAWWGPDLVELAEGRVLDIIDMALQTDRGLHFEVEVLGMIDDPAAGQASWIERGMWPQSSTRARDVEKLDELLRDGRSVHAVWWTPPMRLVRRTDPTTQATLAQALATKDTTASGLLARAWSKAYGHQPDPDGAYLDAVRAVETLACPLVLPTSSRATLSSVVKHLRDDGQRPDPSKRRWELGLTKLVDGSVEPLVEMFDRLWHGNLASRHGSLDYREVTLDEARAAVHLAVTCVQWLADGVLHPRTTPGTP
jgi:hypothetical protein